MTILFLHGWRSVPGGVKPTFLAEGGHRVLNPHLDDDDLEAAVRTAQAEYDRHRPDVIVGSSRGGAVALNMDSGDTPLVLLCPAWKRWGTVRSAKPGTVILHSRGDEVIPFAESEELVRVSGLSPESLIEVGRDHRLADPEPLGAMRAACERHRPPRDDYRNVVLAAGPVGYWPLAEDPFDRSGGGHHGQEVDGPTYVSDATGGWLHTDGRSCVAVPSAAVFSQPTSGRGLSVEVWYRTDAIEFPTEYVHWLGKGEKDRQEWAFRLYRKSDPETPSRLSAYLWSPPGGLGAGDYAQKPLQSGEWRHLVACFDPGDAGDPEAGVQFYCNGSLHQPRSPEPTRYNHPCWKIHPAAGDAPVRFGRREHNRPGLAAGMAEIAIYPRVLPAHTIQEHFEAGAPHFE